MVSYSHMLDNGSAGRGLSPNPGPGALRLRAARAKAVALGKCIVCCKRRARKERTTCKTCYERNKAALYRRRKAARQG